MLTDTADTVFDPFGGSCVTGEVCERLQRNWICCEIVPEYIDGAKGRFLANEQNNTSSEPDHYKIFSPSVLWNGVETEEPENLPADGGKKRPKSKKKNIPKSKIAEKQPIQPSLFD
jgi:site-specific DNA-methyltransferase (cytosine-N4-specific)